MSSSPRDQPKTANSTPKQRLMDAKLQAAMYEQEERTAEVAYVAHSISESFISSTLSSVMGNVMGGFGDIPAASGAEAKDAYTRAAPDRKASSK